MMRGLIKNRMPVISWALYDFANTIFSMNVLSLYFALWFIRDHGGKDIHYGMVYAASMIMVIVIAPLLGRLADLKNWRLLFLILSTVICAKAIAMIGILNGLVSGLVFFFIANTSYQLALVFYDGLLPSVAKPQEYGRVSGFGVALGYAGSIAGIAMVAPFAQVGAEVARHHAFVPTAILFLLFALPCFIWVREKNESPSGGQKAFSLRQNLEALRRYPGIPAYLVARFLIQNAVNTIILFMGLYTAEVGGLDQKAINLFFMLATAVAFLSAILHGQLTDRFGPRPVFAAVLWIWLAALLIAVFGPGKISLWLAGCLIGAGLGGLWTTSRPLLLTLIPKEEAATFFGFNVLAGRFAAIVGPLVWGLVVVSGEPLGLLRYRLAVAALAVFLVAGFYAFRFIPKK